MRTVSFVECFELDFEGSVFSKAMVAADVDNDDVNRNTAHIVYISRDSRLAYWTIRSPTNQLAVTQVADE